ECQLRSGPALTFDATQKQMPCLIAWVSSVSGPSVILCHACHIPAVVWGLGVPLGPKAHTWARPDGPGLRNTYLIERKMCVCLVCVWCVCVCVLGCVCAWVCCTCLFVCMCLFDMYMYIYVCVFVCLIVCVCVNSL